MSEFVLGPEYHGEDHFFGSVTVAPVVSLVLFFFLEVGKRVYGRGEGKLEQVSPLACPKFGDSCVRRAE